MAVGGLSVQVLGAPRVYVDEAFVDLRGRPLLILLRLATAGTTPVTAARLQTDIWDADIDEGAVRVNLTRIRRKLGDGVVVRRNGGYLLADARLDADRFDDLIAHGRDRSARIPQRISAYDEALGMWRGRAYEGIEKHPWVETVALSLDELREQAIDERLELRSLVEDPARLVPDIVTALEQQPLREYRVELLATTLYRSQRQADALAVIRDARRALIDVGLDLGPSLDDLEHQILVHDPSLLLTPLAIATTIRPDIEGQIRAATSLIRAGAFAEALGLIDAAESAATQAADRRSLAESLLARARHASMSGAADPLPVMGRARRLARELRDGPLLAKIAVAGFGHGAPGDLEAGFTELMEPLELLPSAAPERVDLLCAAAAMVGVSSGSSAGEALLAAAVEINETQGTDRTAAVLAATRCIVAAATGGAPDDVEANALEALELARSSDDPALAVVTAHALMRARYARGDLEGVDQLLAPLLAAGRAAMFPFAIVRVSICRGMHAIARAQLDRAETLIADTAAAGVRLRTLNTSRAVTGQRSLLLYELGRLPELLPDLEAQAVPGSPHASTYLAMLALADPARPSPSTFAHQVPDGATLPPFVAIASRVAAARDDEELASWCLAHLERMGEAVLSTGLGTMLFGFAPQLRADLRAVLGDLDGAIADYERAIELTQPSGALLWLDHARVGLAGALVRRDRPDDRRRADILLEEVREGPVVAISPRLAAEIESGRYPPTVGPG